MVKSHCGKVLQIGGSDKAMSSSDQELSDVTGLFGVGVFKEKQENQTDQSERAASIISLHFDLRLLHSVP